MCIRDSPFAVSENLLQQDDVADSLIGESGHDVHRFIEDDFLAFAQAILLDSRAHIDAKLASSGEDVDRAIVVLLQERAEASGRLCEPIDLFLERDNLIPCFAQGVTEALILAVRRGKTRLKFGDAAIE